MEKRKNLCAMIPETLYTQVCFEKEKLELTLSQYVEKILKEHFEGGKTMDSKVRTLAFQVSEELFVRLKQHLKKNGMNQKEFIIALIEQALAEAESQEETQAQKPSENQEKTQIQEQTENQEEINQ